MSPSRGHLLMHMHTWCNKMAPWIRNERASRLFVKFDIAERIKYLQRRLRLLSCHRPILSVSRSFRVCWELLKFIKFHFINRHQNNILKVGHDRVFYTPLTTSTIQISRMSAKDQMRAMLDQLMGTTRDGKGITYLQIGKIKFFFYKVRVLDTTLSFPTLKSARAFCWDAALMRSWPQL